MERIVAAHQTELQPYAAISFIRYEGYQAVKTPESGDKSTVKNRVTYNRPHLKDVTMKLFIGSKRYSSWSLRPWLLLKTFNIPFTENLILFENVTNKRDFTQHTKDAIAKISPSSRVPALHLDDGKTVVHDSLAICETINEMCDGTCWPSNVSTRSESRSIANELHSQFLEIRKLMPLCCGVVAKWKPAKIGGILDEEINRLESIIQHSSVANGKKYLFGSFSIADTMMAPYLLRLYYYRYPVQNLTARYIQSILNMPHIKNWIRDAALERSLIPEIEYLAKNFPDRSNVELKL